MRNAFRIGSLVAAVLFAAGVLLATGCSDDSATRSVLHAYRLNENQSLSSDVVKVAGDGSPYILEDAVTLFIQSDPHDGVLNLDPNGPYGFVTVDRYEIRWESSENIPPVQGSLGWVVGTGESVTGSFVVVPAALKMQPPLVGLIQGGEIQATAHITFFGREATSGYEVRFESSLPVHFANWIDD